MSEPEIFRLYMWPHRLLLLGPGFETDCHRHHAAQLSLSLGSSALSIRGNQVDDWQTAAAFYIPPDRTHQLGNVDGTLALLYLDPESRECMHACQQFGGSDIAGFGIDQSTKLALHNLLYRGGDIEQADQLCGQILGYADSEGRALDERLRRALVWLDKHLHGSIRLADLAEAAGSSESWLTHRFTEVIGVPVRRYVLWRRLRLAMEAALGGASLTQAAHQAGFADSAHLSRSFRETFGVAPSFLFRGRGQLSVTMWSD